MEYGVHKERYQKLKETITNIFEGTTEELNELIDSYDTTLKEKNNEIAEVNIDILIINILLHFYVCITHIDLLHFIGFRMKLKSKLFLQKKLRFRIF